MESRTVRSVVLRSFTAARKVCGFAIVFVAFSGIAQAWGGGGGGGGGGTVPEMDAGTMSSAVTLFLGGILMLKNRLGGR